MPISYTALFIALVLIHHVALQRIAAADELSDKALTGSAPLCSGLLTGITLVLSIMCLEWLTVYTHTITALHILEDFTYLFVIAFVTHLLCWICYKLKPAAVIPALFPVIYLNSIGLGVLVEKINWGFSATITAFIVATAFIVTASTFYYGDFYFNATPYTKKFSLTLLMAGIVSLLISGLITFH